MDGPVATAFLLLGRYTVAITYIGGGGMENCLDIVAFIHFLVDLLLILGTNRICARPLGAKRAVAAAAVGAVYAVGCVLPGFSFLGVMPWRIIFLVLMGMVAFGLDYSALRPGVLFLLLRMAMGGIALGVGKGGFWAVVMAALSVCLMCLLGYDGRPGQQYLPITITHRGRTLHLTALVDTGNTLRDPVSGLPVLVADASAGEKLLCLTQHQLQHPIETIAAGGCPGLRLIPYTAVGQTNGLLLGLRVEELSIGGKREDMIVAFAPQQIGAGKAYQALAGGFAG